MTTKDFSCSIQNLRLRPSESNPFDDNCIITATSPFKSENFSAVKPKTYAYSNKKTKLKLLPFSVYKGLTSPNNRYNNIYKTIFDKADLKKNKNLKHIFPKISMSIDKNKYKNIYKSENNKNNALYSSIFKMIKASHNKFNIKKENLFFMKEKKSEINNIHKNIMNDNKLHILLTQNNELNDNKKDINIQKDNKNKFSYISLTEENKSCFDNEYNNICKNKLKEKNLIKKELNDIGRQFSWVRNFKNNEMGVGENYKNGYNENVKIKNNLLSNLFLKRIKGKDPILEINQTSSFPIIGVDKKLISDLWKKDMIKYSKYTLDIEKPKDKRFLSDLLDVYD